MVALAGGEVVAVRVDVDFVVCVYNVSFFRGWFFFGDRW